MKRLVISMMVFVAVPAMAQSPANLGVASAGTVWNGMTQNIIKSAEQMPEADYAYKPVATVRSFGELIGHVAGAQYMFCAAALGEAPRGEADVENTVKTKAGLVDAIKASTEYCKRAYAQTDAASAATTKLFGGDVTRMYALSLNAAHNGEHYGNIVTYLRMKGMVPPSSQPRAGQ